MNERHDITAVEVIGEHRGRLTFDNGTSATSFLALRVGATAWPGELDMAPEAPYEAARRHVVVTR